MTKDCIEQLETIEQAIQRYHDVIGDEAREIATELRLDLAQQLRATLSTQADSSRMLHIGIVGRVKAGKSSLLNSLFFDGDTVLPKAATPMTAALTILSWGETFSAKVDFFSTEDIADIKVCHDKYKEDWDSNFVNFQNEAKEQAKRRNEPINPDEIEKKARRQADKEMHEKSTYSSYDQYERMIKSGQKPEKMGKRGHQQICATDLNQLIAELGTYVGSTGTLMPFTKSVTIQLPIAGLNDISVVDTPGINDPVKSREERTEQYLKNCDVVFVVSPAGQFLSKEDMELMDRMSRKEGIQELFLIASLVDNQLHGDKLETCGHNLIKAIESIRLDLSVHAVENLRSLKENHPEVGDIYDQLIEGGKNRVIVSSGLAYSVWKKFEDSNLWDSDMSHMMGLLNQNYPDYFTKDIGKANLEKLANVGGIHENLAFVRNAKDQILQQKQGDYLAQQAIKINDFQVRLIKHAEDTMDQVKRADLSVTEKQKKDITKIVSLGESAVDDEFADQLKVFKDQLRGQVKTKIKSIFKDTDEKVSSMRESKTESYKRESSGPISWLARTFGVGGYETGTTTFTEVRTGAVKNAVDDLTRELENFSESSTDDAVCTWKKALQSNLLRVLRETVSDEYIEISIIKKALRNLTNDLPSFNISYAPQIPHPEKKQKETKDASSTFSSIFASLAGNKRNKSFRDYTGTLRDREANAFMESAMEYVGYLKTRVNEDINDFLKTMEASLSAKKPSVLLFEQMHNQVATLEKQVKDKTLTLDRVGGFMKAIRVVTVK